MPDFPPAGFHLSDEQIDYITTTTNTRGKAYTKQPYWFASTGGAGDGRWLTISVVRNSDGEMFAETKKGPPDWWKEAGKGLERLVDDILTTIERQL